MKLEEFNALPFARAEKTLLDCCGATRWAARMAENRPFTSLSSVCEAADSVWQGLEAADWLEAFSWHPPIGEKAGARSEPSRKWAAGEQAGARIASDDVKAKLAQGNKAYREKFGYIFIVCATGKSAEEMLALLEQRLQNDLARELTIATEQQRQITRLRLEKLLNVELSSP